MITRNLTKRLKRLEERILPQREIRLLRVVYANGTDGAALGGYTVGFIAPSGSRVPIGPRLRRPFDNSRTHRATTYRKLSRTIGVLPTDRKMNGLTSRRSLDSHYPTTTRRLLIRPIEHLPICSGPSSNARY